MNKRTATQPERRPARQLSAFGGALIDYAAIDLWIARRLRLVDVDAIGATLPVGPMYGPAINERIDR